MPGGLLNHLIITGTDPATRKGGIGFALPGYLAAIDCAEIAYMFIPTYHPSALGGSWWWLLRALPVLGWRLITNRLYGRRSIVYSHAGAGISLLREGIVLALSRLCGAKTVVQLHAITVDDYLRHPWKRFLFLLATFPATAIAVLTPWWRRRLTDAGINKRIFVIPNPMPVIWEEKARSRFERKEHREEFIVLTMTRIEPGKGVDLLIEAMPLLPDSLRLVVAGDGSQLRMLKDLVKGLGVDARVRFVGWVEDDEKQRLLDEADLFCLPSSYDSFGMGFLEAMANGIPVVALDWGPVADVVVNGRCGILIRDKDTKLLAGAIERMMDPVLRQRMSKEARSWVIEKFVAQKIGASIRAMFEDVMAR